MQISSVELRDAVLANPVRTLAIAFAAGAVLALAQRSRGALSRAFVAALSGAALSVAREHFAARARSWIDEPRVAAPGAVVH